MTIVECRARWREDYGPEWTRGGVALLRYVAKYEHWVLYGRDRNQKWHRYDLIEPSSDVLVLPDEIDRDRIGISGDGGGRARVEGGQSAGRDGRDF